MPPTLRWHAATLRTLCSIATLAVLALLSPMLLPAAAQAADVSFVRRVDGALRQPVGLVGARNGTHHLYVLERRGTVRTYEPATDRLRSGFFLDLRSVVEDGGGEQGLLGMAFDPAYRSGRPYVYVAYTEASGALQIARLQAASASATSVPASSRRDVLEIPHPTYRNHNAGQLLFSGGYLYISTGDGGGAGDPLDNARDRTSLSGKLLRVDVSASCPRVYCIPATNPYAGSSAFRQAIWAYGLRNPWRFSVDRANGYLWVADVGQDRTEEVTILPAGAGGLNLGWPCVEGTRTYDAARCSGTARTAPFLTYDHDLGASVIGGYVYRGAVHRDRIGGRYLFGDYVSGAVWIGTGGGSFRREATLPQLTAFGEGELGEVYAVTYDGSLWSLRVS